MNFRAGTLTLMALLACACAQAGPYVWDQDEDGIDDRMETVQVLGYRFAFVDADTLQPLRFQVEQTLSGLVYTTYVVYDHAPTQADLAMLNGLGVPVLHRLLEVPAVRTTMTFVQAGLVKNNLPGVERIEVVPVQYPALHDAAAALGVTDASQTVFPCWDTGSAPVTKGDGEVIAILDTGINDAADGGYPGHEALLGRVLGGADYTHGDSLLDTPNASSVNPSDHGGLATKAHATHIAGIVAGSGGTTGYARGLAPNAKLVDVKVLGDLGRGSAVAEAIDWCIANRNRNWGDPDASYKGIDVIEMALSSTDLSDGNDVASRAAARAIEKGIVVVASIGNDGLPAHVPSPAAGDGVIAVGAWDIQRSGRPGDDLPATFNNSGPRAGDGDLDEADEQKPTLLAPGVAILAPDGDPSSDGAQYRRASGTSAASAMVAGAAALLRSAQPSLNPSQVTELLAATARRDLPGLSAGTPGIDPRWDSVRGFGLLDVYAAGLEQAAPAHTQVRRLDLSATDSTFHAEICTQREMGAAFLALERASSQGGPYAAYDSFATTGDGSLTDVTNRTVYARAWNVPPGERGHTYWYRTAYTEGGTRSTGPARPVTLGIGASAATLEAVIVHNAYDHDLDAAFEAVSGYAGAPGVLNLPLPASSSAFATGWVDGLSATGNVELSFRTEVPVALAQGFLPPSDSSPWTLRVNEGGFLNRSGKVTRFRLTWHAPGGDVVYDGSPQTAPTIEGATTRVRIPAGVVGIPDGPGAPAAPSLRAFPNPASSGATIAFAAVASGASEVLVYDLSGRLVGRVPLVATDGPARASWQARDRNGVQLAPGIYFARAGRAPAQRVVLLSR